MLHAGLTGGIGCGKSTVAAMMADLGCHVIYADRISRQLLDPGKAAYEDVVREFGQEILAADRTVDRARLASIVFNDATQLAKLNAIIHPRVYEEEDRILKELEHTDQHGIAVVEAALLIEAGSYKRLDRLIVCWCTPEQQLARLTDISYGRAMQPEDAQRRMAAQLSVDEKRRMADDVIDCSGTVEETQQQVAALVERLTEIEKSRARTTAAHSPSSDPDR
jgi:dephospho-CoA kinase